MCFSQVKLVIILFAFCITIDLSSCRHHHPHHHNRHHKHLKHIYEQWDNFKTFLNKKYNDTEEKNRKNIFETNLKEVAKHNELYEKGRVSYKMAMNEFGDMSQDEFVNIYGLKLNSRREFRNKSKGYFADSEKHNHHLSKRSVGYRHKLVPKHAPSHIDWRDKGAVTPVQHQLLCRSCYAFSAVGAIEAQYFIKGHKLKKFSEQNILDCSCKVPDNMGCEGGHAKQVFKYLKNKKYQVGLQTEDKYEYLGREWKCRYDMRSYRKYYKSGPNVKGYTILPVSEVTLKQKVAIYGPVAVEIDYSGVQLYSEGVFYNNKCTSDVKQMKVVHAMLVVGYGSDKKQGDYWILKNSWGKHWGENGYMRLARNRGNHCGIANEAIIVNLK